jgi:hypothetical protein
VADAGGRREEWVSAGVCSVEAVDQRSCGHGTTEGGDTPPGFAEDNPALTRDRGAGINQMIRIPSAESASSVPRMAVWF